MGRIYVLMGVSGSGKSTVGRALARELGCPFYDGDDFHPPENVDKMARGIPLNDEDRYPWLTRLSQLIAALHASGETAVVTCSALKKAYRDRLREGNEFTVFVFLDGEFELIWGRMKRRPGHYMKAEMLRSQYESLEKPDAREALRIGVDQEVNAIVATVLAVDWPTEKPE